MVKFSRDIVLRVLDAKEHRPADLSSSVRLHCVKLHGGEQGGMRKIARNLLLQGLLMDAPDLFLKRCWFRLVVPRLRDMQTMAAPHGLRFMYYPWRLFRLAMNLVGVKL